MANFNLTSQQIKDTYEQLAQVSASLLVDGTGSLSPIVTSSIINFPTEVSRSAAAAGFGNTAGLVTEATFTAYTASNDSKVNSLISATSSYALKTEISGAFTSTSASIAVDIATNTSNIGTLTAATSSYALKTAISGAFNTSSLLVTASFSNPNLTFTKGDGTTFQQSLVSLVPTSASHAVNSDFAITASFAINVVPLNTGSFLVTSSISNATTTFTKGDGTTFSLTTNNVQNAFTASIATSASFATTATSASRATSAASADTATFATSATSASYAISSSHSVSSSFATFALSTNTGFSATGSFTGSTWVFNHNLNKEYIIVDCYDSNEEEIIPQTIDLTSPNQATITFPISVQGVALASLGSGINNIPLVTSYFNDLMFSTVDYIIDAPGDVLSTPITVHISESGVYLISASKVPPYGQNGPRVNLEWNPQQMGSGTAKVIFYIPNLDTGTGITYKQNVSCSADYQYIWNSITSPAATTAATIARNITNPQFSQGNGVTTMIKGDTGYVYFSLGTGWPTTGVIFTGPSLNPLI